MYCQTVLPICLFLQSLCEIHFYPNFFFYRRGNWSSINSLNIIWMNTITKLSNLTQVQCPLCTSNLFKTNNGVTILFVIHKMHLALLYTLILSLNMYFQLKKKFEFTTIIFQVSVSKLYFKTYLVIKDESEKQRCSKLISNYHQLQSDHHYIKGVKKEIWSNKVIEHTQLP